MKAKRALLWTLGLSSAVLAAIAIGVVNDLKKMDVRLLQSCMQVDPQPFSGLCEQYFYRFHPTPDEVKELNTTAGARFAFMAKNESDARRVLKHYLDAGVDINAVDQHMDATLNKKEPRKWTALHGAVLGSHLMEVKLLLEFGASREVRDAKGRTPLELARELQAKNPSPQREEAIRLLEADKP